MEKKTNKKQSFIPELKELVAFLKKEKIMIFKKGDLEITFSGLALLEENSQVNQETPKVNPITSEKTIMEDSNTPQRDETNESKEQKEQRNLLGGYTEEELFHSS